MARPKSDNFVAFKCPTELRDAAIELAQRGGKTESEVWKEAMEFRLCFLEAIRVGYWELRMRLAQKPVEPGLTIAVKG